MSTRAALRVSNTVMNVTVLSTLLYFLVLSIVIKSGCEATNCEYGDIRLVGGRTVLEGRVEVCNNMGVWERVCNDGWDNYDATVVCRQLGFSQVDSLALRKRQDIQSFLNSTATSFLFNEVNCNGFELRLINCSKNQRATCDRSGIEDAGVRCKLLLNISTSCSNTSVRLTWNPVDNRITKYLEVKCFYMYKNTSHTAHSMVSSDITSVQLDGLAPSTLYNCCVLANSSTTTTICIEALTLASNKSKSLSIECTNGSGIVVGVLAFLNALFIVLLILAAAALVYFIITILKQKEQIKISRNLNVKVYQLETEDNPSYSSGSIARKDFSKYNQITKSRIGNQVDSVRSKNRYGEIQKTKKDSPNEASSQRGCGVHGKHPPTWQRLNPEEKIETNPSYSTVPLPGVGEYSVIGPLYEKSGKKSSLSASLKVKTDDKKGIRDSPRAKSLYAYKQQRERQEYKSAQAQQLSVESNPAYSALPGTDGEYSLVGPVYHKVSKATLSDIKVKHEYAEIKEANVESEESLQEKYSSSLTGFVYDGTGLNRDEDDDMNPIQHDEPADIQPGECDGREDQATEEVDNATPISENKDDTTEGETCSMD